MVKRFQDDISMGGDWTNSTSFMAEKPDGEYVLFSDYEKLEQENARLRDAIGDEILKEAIELLRYRVDPRHSKQATRQDVRTWMVRCTAYLRESNAK